MTRVIGLDFDDVLVDLCSWLCLFHNARYGTALTKEDHFTYRLSDVWGCTDEETRRRIREFYGSPEHAATAPMLGAVEAVRVLERGNTIAVITARPESVRSETFALLARHFPSLVQSIHFARHHFHKEGNETKGEICRRLGVQMFVEDLPFHVEDIAPVVGQVLLFDAPWNRGYAPSRPNIRRVRSWGEILAFLAETE